MDTLIHPTYFPSIAHFVAIAKAENLTFEVCDNYQKQTYRNRAYIYAANGKLLLNIPIKHTQKNRQLYKDVKIANDSRWQDLHWKSLESAYRTSPFFEFYEDEFQPLFTGNETFLLDFNLKCLEVVFDCLQLPFEFSTTEHFEIEPNHKTDYRFLANSRKERPHNFDSYTQVFDDKHGFIPNLSILDLLFNEGTNAMSYLESQQLRLP